MISDMGAVVTTMTFEEFEALPDGPEDRELLEGELIEMPPPQCSHMENTEGLYNGLLAAVNQKKNEGELLGKVHMEMPYLLTSKPRSWLRPDVSLTHPSQPRGKYYEGAPLMVFEIISDNDRAVELNRKVRVFMRCGAQEVWHIYPQTREAYIFKAGVPNPVHEMEAVHSDLLPGIRIPFDQFLGT